jgi:hypothetical protein
MKGRSNVRLLHNAVAFTSFFKQQMNIGNLFINPGELYTLIIVASPYDNPTSITLVNYAKIYLLKAGALLGA